MRISAVLLLIVLFTLALIPAGDPQASTEDFSKPTANKQKAILITGASSGIGRKTAEVLAAEGYYVFAGARKDKDLKELDAIHNVEGIRLDVTVQADIDAAVKTVEDAGFGLYGLINNAGVVVLAPLIEAREGDLDFQMDVNVMGPYRVTKAFAPMLIESKGRISVTSSISGFLCWGLGGPYSMSKHAIEAYTEVLAQEMAPFGVKVSIVEPGNYKSKITTSMRQRLIDSGYTTEGSLYKGQMEGLLGSNLDRGQYKEPDDVAKAFVHAMGDDNPKLRYMVVPNQNEAEMTIRANLNRVVQLNEGQEFTYSRDDLVKMLDEALAAAE